MLPAQGPEYAVAGTVRVSLTGERVHEELEVRPQGS